MSRTRRVSRPLIAVLAIILVLGVFLCLHNLKKASAADRAAHAEASTPAPAAVHAPDGAAVAAAAAAAIHAQPVVSSNQTPTTQPMDALVTETPGLAPAKQKAASADDASSAGRFATAGQVSTSVIASPVGGGAVAATPVSTTALESAPKHDTHPATPQAALADAKARKEAGDLLAARTELNDALLSGQLSPSDVDSARQITAEINQTVIFSPKKFSEDPFGGVYAVQSGERLATIAGKHGVTWELLARVNGIDPRRLRSGSNIKVVNGPFHAVVYKGVFRMDVYLGAPGDAGSLFVTSFPVGLGKDGSTPTGTWMVQSGNKIRHPKYYSPRGEGVIDADDPKNPLGGYWVGLQGLDGQAVGKNSYGVHGTIDASSIGKQESMGCIRLRADDISLLFDMLVEGKSKVVVKD